jgi:hypothetical protein
LIPIGEQAEEPAAVAAQTVAHEAQSTAAKPPSLHRRLPEAAIADPSSADEIPAVEAPASVAVAPPSPVSKYVASRTRARRNQTTIAVLLLMAVLVLAAVLVWVLQREPAAPGPSDLSMESSFNRGLPPAAEVWHRLT